MLKRIYSLKNELQAFIDIKGYYFPYFNDKEWMCDFGFLIDITQKLNDLNLQLQGKGQFIHNLIDKIKGFERKLKLWRTNLKQNNAYYFPSLGKETPLSTVKYANYIDLLINEFEIRFKKFYTDKFSILLKIFSSPFNIDVDKIPPEYQMEIIDMQSNSNLKNAFFTVDIQTFYKLYVGNVEFPLLAKNAKKMMLLFGSTYACEQLFSTMNFIKNDHRSRLSDGRLESCIRVAISSIQTDIDQIVAKKQCQNSH
uniref:General transcription factor II-I repeat domain-containing protein 2 n=1 Tax=Nosema bombycis TaxID=27978 RepID=Q15EY1_NOSBO|nr:unknown [Nosema bombycis]